MSFGLKDIVEHKLAGCGRRIMIIHYEIAKMPFSSSVSMLDNLWDLFTPLAEQCIGGHVATVTPSNLCIAYRAACLDPQPVHLLRYAMDQSLHQHDQGN